MTKPKQKESNKKYFPNYIVFSLWTCRELEHSLQNLECRNSPDCPKEIQTELAKLRQSETEKRREIEKLKVELSKSHFNICQLQEQVQRDQKLLEVRSHLITSLQNNDNSQRIHLEELFAQVGEKNGNITEVNYIVIVYYKTHYSPFLSSFSSWRTNYVPNPKIFVMYSQR